MHLLDQHDPFTPLPEIEEVADWRRSDPQQMGSTPKFLLQPTPDQAPDYRQFLLPEELCPACGELLDGPECPHDWAAIAHAEQAGRPYINVDLRGPQ